VTERTCASKVLSQPRLKESEGDMGF
jgi:hypothetical protein